MSSLQPPSPIARVIRGFMFSLAALLPFAAQAASDLMAVYVKALDANPDYQSALAGFHQALEAKPQALSRLLPQVAAFANAAEAEQSISGRYFVGTSSLAPEGFDVNRHDQFYSVGYQIGLSQVVYHHDLFIALDQAELKVGAAGLLIYSAQSDLRIGTADVYFGVLGSDDRLHFAQAERDAIHQLADQINNKYRSGLVTEADVKQAQAEADSADAELIVAQNGVQTSRAQLEQLTGGQRFDVLKVLSPNYAPETLIPNRVEDWTERARKQNLKVQAQRYSTQIAQLEVDRARALRYPTLDLLAGHQFSYADGGVSRGIGADDNHEREDRVLLNMKLPIYSGGAVSSAIRAALAGYDKARYDEISETNQAVKEAQVAFLNSGAQQAQVLAYRQALQSAQVSEAAARVGYEVGTKTFTDVLQAVRKRFEAERDYALARYSSVINILKLKRASGALSDTDLLTLNRWLQ